MTSLYDVRHIKIRQYQDELGRYTNMYFDEVKKNFGFGCMRLPMVENGKAVDIEQTKKMVDTFIEQGFLQADIREKNIYLLISLL